MGCMARGGSSPLRRMTRPRSGGVFSLQGRVHLAHRRAAVEYGRAVARATRFAERLKAWAARRRPARGRRGRRTSRSRAVGASAARAAGSARLRTASGRCRCCARRAFSRAPTISPPCRAGRTSRRPSPTPRRARMPTIPCRLMHPAPRRRASCATTAPTWRPTRAGKARLVARIVAGAGWHVLLVFLLAAIVFLPLSWLYAAMSDQLAGTGTGHVLPSLGWLALIAAVPFILALACNFELWRADRRRVPAERASVVLMLVGALLAILLVVVPEGVLLARAVGDVAGARRGENRRGGRWRGRRRRGRAPRHPGCRGDAHGDRRGAQHVRLAPSRHPAARRRVRRRAPAPAPARAHRRQRGRDGRFRPAAAGGLGGVGRPGRRGRGGLRPDAVVAAPLLSPAPELGLLRPAARRVGDARARGPAAHMAGARPDRARAHRRDRSERRSRGCSSAPRRMSPSPAPRRRVATRCRSCSPPATSVCRERSPARSPPCCTGAPWASTGWRRRRSLPTHPGKNR